MTGPLRAAALAMALAATATAFAGDGHHAARVAYPPQYAQECGSCHVAYPPGMLPAASWQRITAALSRHFGTDASLDAPQLKSISSWLQSNAGTYRRVDAQPAQDRITRSAWYIRKHDEVRADVWKRAAVRGPSNCSACHPNAAEGSFNEHDIRIPR
ncbi:MAG: diheme cytochrome c [Betaproteobacteria bacterium]